MSLLFESVRIEPDQFQLFRDERLVPIEPRVFDLVVVLASNPGTVFSKDELLELVWHGRLVSDTTIATAIKQARKALDDDGRQQRLIQTVHGRGFRFVGAVEDAKKRSVTSLPVEAASPFSPCLLVLPFEGVLDGLDLRYLHSQLETIFYRVPLLNISAEAGCFSGVAMQSMRSIFDEVGATHLLQGFTEGGGSNSLVVQLTDTRTGFRIWSGSFGCDSGKAQSRESLVHSIVRKLEPQLVKSIYQMVCDYDGDQSASALYLRAHGLLSIKGWHAATFTEASELLQQSLKLRPEFAQAAAYLSLLLAFGHRIGLLPDSGQSELAQQYGEQALQQSNQDSTILGFVGCAFCDLGNSERGVPLLMRAIDLNVHNAQARVALGGAYLSIGRLQEAIENLKKGIDISPHDSRLAVWRSLLAVALLLAKHPLDSERVAEMACCDDDQVYMPRVVLAAARLKNLNADGASRAMAEAFRVKPDLSAAEVAGLVGEKLASKLLSLESD